VFGEAGAPWLSAEKRNERWPFKTDLQSNIQKTIGDFDDKGPAGREPWADVLERGVGAAEICADGCRKPPKRRPWAQEFTGGGPRKRENVEVRTTSGRQTEGIGSTQKHSWREGTGTRTMARN